VARRLDDLVVIAFDRRGYQHSRHAGPAVGLDGHADDLLAIAAAVADASGAAPAAVGHSLGGDVVIGAALRRPELFCSIGAYEPPMPWLGLADPAPSGGAPGRGRWAALDDDDPGGEVERFFRRMVGDAAWERLAEGGRQQRRRDGPALIADLRGIRGPAPFDVTALAVPTVFACGGEASTPRHRRTVQWLAENVAGAALVRIDHAGHGAHLSQPDAFAGFVRAVVAAGASPRTDRSGGDRARSADPEVAAS
jgi:pimeloyl-ACP methyl ester carboxylesterase